MSNEIPGQQKVADAAAELDSFDLNKELRMLSLLSSGFTAEVWGDIKSLKLKYPTLESFGIRVGSSPRGANVYSVYFIKNGNEFDIKMIDYNQGNYAGGTVWSEGDSQDKLIRYIKIMKETVTV